MVTTIGGCSPQRRDPPHPDPIEAVDIASPGHTQAGFSAHHGHPPYTTRWDATGSPPPSPARYFPSATTIASGAVASSIALIGFGLDSTVEVLSASVIVWQMTRPVPEEREARALRLIALSFIALAAYVTVQAVLDLAQRHEPQTSTAGIVLAIASLIVMSVLAWLKRRNGRRLGSTSVVADSSQTLLCTYLSAVLLVGLLLNATAGWWWADPLAAFVIAGLALREARGAWRGERCCDDDACFA